MLHYWLAVFIKTFWDSLGFAEKSRDGLMFWVLVLVITLVFLIKKHGWRNALKNYWRTSGEGLVIVAIAFVLVCIVHFAFEPFHLQNDEQARTVSASTERDKAETGTLVCEGDLKGARSKADVLQAQVAAQQGTINGQLGTAFTQQSTFNLCVTTLAKTSLQEPPRINILTDYVPVPSKAWKHRAHMLVTTNKDVPVTVVRITCDYTMGEVQAFITGGAQMLGTVKKVLTNSALISMQSPPWTTATPLNVDVWFDEDDLGLCSVMRQ